MAELVQRAWGTYEVLIVDSRYKVKRLIMDPGKEFSYQYHHHRRESWTVVEGSILFKDHDGKDHIVPEGESVFIRPGAKHKMSNPGKVPAIVIEVQYGSYLEEDDIVRLD